MPTPINIYNNWAQVDPVYQPARRIISAITNSDPAIVTTTFPHNFFTGTIVRILVPKFCNMEQINKQTGTITVIDDVTFSITIDSTFYDAYVTPDPNNPPYGYNPAQDMNAGQVMPIGTNLSGVNEFEIRTKNVLP